MKYELWKCVMIINCVNECTLKHVLSSIFEIKYKWDQYALFFKKRRLNVLWFFFGYNNWTYIQ